MRDRKRKRKRNRKRKEEWKSIEEIPQHHPPNPSP
jgi:hypothetical protein